MNNETRFPAGVCLGTPGDFAGVGGVPNLAPDQNLASPPPSRRLNSETRRLRSLLMLPPDPAHSLHPSALPLSLSQFSSLDLLRLGFHLLHSQAAAALGRSESVHFCTPEALRIRLPSEHHQSEGAALSAVLNSWPLSEAVGLHPALCPKLAAQGMATLDPELALPVFKRTQQVPV
ncbi:hypothetical protein E2320_012795 [Naja naja]|nr:hypothetical protein E2320_012795 [Naja naja]